MVAGISFKTTTVILFERPLYLEFPAFFFLCCADTTHSIDGSNFLFLEDILAHAGNNVDIAFFVESLGVLSFSQSPLILPESPATCSCNTFTVL